MMNLAASACVLVGEAAFYLKGGEQGMVARFEGEAEGVEATSEATGAS